MMKPDWTRDDLIAMGLTFTEDRAVDAAITAMSPGP